MSAAPEPRARVVVGGVGELWQGDYDLGRVAVERLAGDGFGPSVLLEEMSYGGLHVAMLLEDLRPEAFVVVGAAARGRPPGTVEHYAAVVGPVSADEARYVLGEALTGYVSIDLALEVPAMMGALPVRTVVVEIEPAHSEPGGGLSPEAAEALERALALVREEVETVLAAGTPA